MITDLEVSVMHEEVERLYGLVRDGLDSWHVGGSSAEQAQALEQLAAFAHNCVDRI